VCANPGIAAIPLSGRISGFQGLRIGLDGLSASSRTITRAPMIALPAPCVCGVEISSNSGGLQPRYARALPVARRTQSGIGHINRPTVHDEAQVPFGRVKASGFGGQAGVAEFTDLRWITLETQGGHFPI
jgi:hypothetical protein